VVEKFGASALDTVRTQHPGYEMRSPVFGHRRAQQREHDEKLNRG